MLAYINTAARDKLRRGEAVAGEGELGGSSVKRCLYSSRREETSKT